MAKIALLIGVSEYEPGLNPLPAAVRDIEALRSVLVNPAIGGFAESDVVLLKNPDQSTMALAIETLFKGRSKDDLVLLFFSGHGIKDDVGRLFLATRGTRKTLQGDLIRSTAVPSSFIQDSMSESRSKRQVVILDSCFSGAFAEVLRAKDDGTIDIRSQLGGEGRAVLTSSSSTQYSFEYEGSELSLYTRFLIEGIQTGAADTDEDEVVSIDELHEYASRKVKEIKPELKPEIFAIREGFKIHLTKVPPSNPKDKYRWKVEQCVDQGNISGTGRRILEQYRIQLSLSLETANEIEIEVLRPYQDYSEKLHEYREAFSTAINQEYPLNNHTQSELRDLREILGLQKRDTDSIEQEIVSQRSLPKPKLFHLSLQSRIILLAGVPILFFLGVIIVKFYGSTPSKPIVKTSPPIAKLSPSPFITPIDDTPSPSPFNTPILDDTPSPSPSIIPNPIETPTIPVTPIPTTSEVSPVTPTPSTKSEYSPEKVGSVADWQHILNGAGFDTLIINDRLDPKTIANTKKFQIDVGLPPTGKIDEKTWQAGLRHPKLAGWIEKTPPIQDEKLNDLPPN